MKNSSTGFGANPQIAADVTNEPATEISLLAMGVRVAERKWFVVGLMAFGALFGAARALLRDRSYVTATSFMQQARRTSPPLAGMAAQLGISLPTMDGSQSPTFYVDLLTSREFMADAVDAHYHFPSEAGVIDGDLTRIYRTHGRTLPLRREEAIRTLRKEVSVSASLRTGVISLTVSADNPHLAQQIAARILTELNTFNVERRMSEAKAERVFTEQRLSQVIAELRAAENALQAFLQDNRQYATSPRLTFERDRLQREVAVRQQVYTTLAQSYEVAKIEEVRDTPAITVIEAPAIAVEPEPRGVGRYLIAGLIAGCLVALGIIFAQDYIGLLRYRLRARV